MQELSHDAFPAKPFKCLPSRLNKKVLSTLASARFGGKMELRISSSEQIRRVGLEKLACAQKKCKSEFSTYQNQVLYTDNRLQHPQNVYLSIRTRYEPGSRARGGLFAYLSRIDPTYRSQPSTCSESNGQFESRTDQDQYRPEFMILRMSIYYEDTL